MNTETNTTTAMAEALSKAKPVLTSNIRRVTSFSGDRIPGLSIYFSNENLVGRRFKLTVLQTGLEIEENLSGALVGNNRGSVHVQFSGRRIPSFVSQNHLNITPTWEHGKLSFIIPVEFTTQNTTLTEPTSIRNPRKATLHELLNQIRKIEKETEYRLERSEDGTLSFVARIK